MTLLEQAGITLGQNVLDVGFRDVQELQAIASLVGPTGRVLGIDVNPRSVETAQAELDKLPDRNVSVKEGSVLDIPVGDGSFDLVLCKGILHEVRQLDRAMQEMARVCKPDGLISIIDVQRFSRFRFEIYRLRARLRGRPSGDVHPGFTREQLLALLSRQGLVKVNCRELSTTWRLGSNEVSLFLLQARRMG